MEDCFIIAYNESDDPEHNYIFIGIFDGHGGGHAARYAKEYLERNITANRLFWKTRDEDVMKAIREGKIFSVSRLSCCLCV